MTTLKKVLAKKIEEHRPRTQKLLKDRADVKLGEVTIGQAIGGARGVRCLVTDVSYLDAEEGIRFRNKDHPGDVRMSAEGAGLGLPLRGGVLVLPADGRRAVDGTDARGGGGLEEALAGAAVRVRRASGRFRATHTR